jgi:hypothetical protein
MTPRHAAARATRATRSASPARRASDLPAVSDARGMPRSTGRRGAAVRRASDSDLPAAGVHQAASGAPGSRGDLRLPTTARCPSQSGRPSRSAAVTHGSARARRRHISEPSHHDWRRMRSHRRWSPVTPVCPLLLGRSVDATTVTVGHRPMPRAIAGTSGTGTRRPNGAQLVPTTRIQTHSAHCATPAGPPRRARAAALGPTGAVTPNDLQPSRS